MYLARPLSPHCIHEEQEKQEEEDKDEEVAGLVDTVLLLTFRQNLRRLKGFLNLCSTSCMAATEIARQLLAWLPLSRLAVAPICCSNPTSPITSNDCLSSRLSMSNTVCGPACLMRLRTWLEELTTCWKPFLHPRQRVPFGLVHKLPFHICLETLSAVRNLGALPQISFFKSKSKQEILIAGKESSACPGDLICQRQAGQPEAWQNHCQNACCNQYCTCCLWG